MSDEDIVFFYHGLQNPKSFKSEQEVFSFVVENPVKWLKEVLKRQPEISLFMKFGQLGWMRSYENLDLQVQLGSLPAERN